LQKIPSAIQLLVVEDNPMDVRLLRHALDRHDSWPTEFVAVVDDGAKAIEYLSTPDLSHPDLVILDLNLPRIDGTEVLKAIRRSEVLRHIPVIVFSSSPEDVIRSKVFAAHVEAEGYITKPVGLNQLLELPERFHECYIGACRKRAASCDK